MKKICVKCGRTFRGRKDGPNICPDCQIQEYMRLQELAKKRKRSEKPNLKQT